MNWWSVLAVLVFLLSIGIGGWYASRSPTFWISFAKSLFKEAWPYIVKRMPPEEEAEWRDAYLRGQGDDWMRERFFRKAKEARDKK